MIARAPAKALSRPVAQSRELVIPTGGWRTDLPLYALPPDAAAVMQNWFPEQSYVRPRRGYAPWSTGLPTVAVGALLPYQGATPRLFAGCNGKLYDVTASPAVISKSGFSSDLWQGFQFANSAGNYLFACNGFDTVQRWDGTTWSGAAITGPGVPSALNSGCSYRSRPWFTEKQSTRIWYLAVGGITGAATVLDCAPFMKKGGYVQSIGTWIQPGEALIQEKLVVVTDQGEVLVYAGTNPADATNWGLMGVFDLGAPIGPYPLIRRGGDLLIMTEDAILALSDVVQLPRDVQRRAGLTKGIAPTWVEASRKYKAQTGWSVAVYPKARMGVINVPNPSGTFQFVWNTITNAWCKFTNINATTWAAWNDGLFFGTADGTVYQAETGSLDGSGAIDCWLVGAYQGFGSETSLKHVKEIKAQVTVETSAVSLYVGCSFDFNSDTPTTIISGTAQAPVFAWSLTKWSQAKWRGTQAKGTWRGQGGVGYRIAPTLRAIISSGNADEVTCQVQGFSLIYEKGGVIG